MAELQFLDVSKVYGRDTVAVRNLNLSVAEGEFVVLVGP
jgi:cell division transport system ATP-binding protein